MPTTAPYAQPVARKSNRNPGVRPRNSGVRRWPGAAASSYSGVKPGQSDSAANNAAIPSATSPAARRPRRSAVVSCAACRSFAGGAVTVPHSQPWGDDAFRHDPTETGEQDRDRRR